MAAGGELHGISLVSAAGDVELHLVQRLGKGVLFHGVGLKMIVIQPGQARTGHRVNDRIPVSGGRASAFRVTAGERNGTAQHRKGMGSGRLPVNNGIGTVRRFVNGKALLLQQSASLIEAHPRHIRHMLLRGLYCQLIPAGTGDGQLRSDPLLIGFSRFIPLHSHYGITPLVQIDQRSVRVTEIFGSRQKMEIGMEILRFCQNAECASIQYGIT